MMSHQQLFEAVLTGEPPARDTLDTLVRRSRRRALARRAAGAGTGLAAAAVAAALLLPGTPPPAMVGAPPGTPTPDVSTPEVSTPDRASSMLLGEEPAELPQDAVVRLPEAVRRAVTGVVPQAVVTGQGYVRREVMPLHLSSTISYEMTADVTAGGVTGALVVTVKRRSVDTRCAAAFPPDVAPPVLRAQCDGQPAATPTVEVLQDDHHDVVRRSVWVDRADGTSVGVAVSTEPALTGPLPLTGEQILRIAADPRLTLYP